VWAVAGASIEAPFTLTSTSLRILRAQGPVIGPCGRSAHQGWRLETARTFPLGDGNGFVVVEPVAQ